MRPTDRALPDRIHPWPRDSIAALPLQRRLTPPPPQRTPATAAAQVDFGGCGVGGGRPIFSSLTTRAMGI